MKKLKTIFLMLGPACNINCQYCLQTGMEKYNTSTLVSDKLFRTLKDLDNPDNKIEIRFFGGEPLLYWRQIKQIVEFTRDLNYKYSVITNGTLLTEDKLNYIAEVDMHVIVSHDGIRTLETRGTDVLADEKLLPLIKHLAYSGRLSILSTLSAYSQDLFDNWTYFYTIFGIPVQLSYEYLNITWDMPKSLYDYDFNKWEKEVDKCCSQVYSMMKSSGILMDCYSSRFIEQHMHEYSGKLGDILPKCGSMKHHINLDLNGNMHMCHNTQGVVGDINQSIDERREIGFNKWMDIYSDYHKPCGDCKYIKYCKGGCPLTPWTEAHQIQCKFEKILYARIDQMLTDMNKLNIEEIRSKTRTTLMFA